MIEEHPGVKSCHTVGVETPAGLRPFAFVQAGSEGAVRADTLAEHCRRRMAPYKVPVGFEFVTDFPVTEGPNQTKVQKAKLRERAAALMIPRS